MRTDIRGEHTFELRVTVTDNPSCPQNSERRRVNIYCRIASKLRLNIALIALSVFVNLAANTMGIPTIMIIVLEGGCPNREKISHDGL